MWYYAPIWPRIPTWHYINLGENSWDLGLHSTPIKNIHNSTTCLSNQAAAYRQASSNYVDIWCNNKPNHRLLCCVDKLYQRLPTALTDPRCRPLNMIIALFAERDSLWFISLKTHYNSSKLTWSNEASISAQSHSVIVFVSIFFWRVVSASICIATATFK